MTVLLGLFVPGHARSKGSMKCIARGAGAKHYMVEQVEQSKPWREKVQAAIIREVRANRVAVGLESLPHPGPVAVTLDFLFNRPATGVGVHLAYPTVAAGVNALGDLDKLTRNILDALQGSGLISNDANVVSIGAEKRWLVGTETAGVKISVHTL